MTRLTPAEVQAARDDVIKHRSRVVQAYRQGRSMGRLADDWEVGSRWLRGQFRGWGEPLRPPKPKGFTGPRLSARVLLLGNDDNGVVLVPAVVRPDGGQMWRLPGGWVPAGGQIADTAARELLSDTGLTRKVTHLVALGEGPASSEFDQGGGCHAVCIADMLTEPEAQRLAAPYGQAETQPRVTLAPLDALDAYAFPDEVRLIRAGVDAMQRGTELPLSALGEPVP